MQGAIVFMAVAVIGLAALIAAGWLGEQQEPVHDVYQPPTPQTISADEVQDVRFGLAPLGYDMAQVDEWMARMAQELDRRDAADAAPESTSKITENHEHETS